jgi:hypothetical protein
LALVFEFSLQEKKDDVMLWKSASGIFKSEHTNYFNVRELGNQKMINTGEFQVSARCISTRCA